MTTLVLIALTLLAASDHASANSLFQELTTKGVVITGETRRTLPLPTMADGLDATGQQAVLAKLVGERYSVDEFTRNSVVAPFVLKFPESRGGEIASRGIEVWFIVYGDLDELAKVDVLKEFAGAKGQDASLHVLTGKELESRGLPAASGDSPAHVAAVGATEERFAHTVASILEKVELHQTMRCMLTRTPESVLIATTVDRRFDGDREFANQYYRFIRDEDGNVSKGPAEEYAGAGGHMKATQLAQPVGAILVEYQSVYSEPRDWFNGANLLQSKLPMLLQSRIRELRRRLQKRS